MPLPAPPLPHRVHRGSWGGGGQDSEFDHMPFRYQVREAGVDHASGCRMGASYVGSGDRHRHSDPIIQKYFASPPPASEPEIQPQDRLMASVQIPVP